MPHSPPCPVGVQTSVWRRRAWRRRLLRRCARRTRTCTPCSTPTSSSQVRDRVGAEVEAEQWWGVLMRMCCRRRCKCSPAGLRPACPATAPAGGTARCPGFRERLHAELRPLVPDDYEVGPAGGHGGGLGCWVLFWAALLLHGKLSEEPLTTHGPNRNPSYLVACVNPALPCPCPLPLPCPAGHPPGGRPRAVRLAGRRGAGGLPAVPRAGGDAAGVAAAGRGGAGQVGPVVRSSWVGVLMQIYTGSLCNVTSLQAPPCRTRPALVRLRVGAAAPRPPELRWRAAGASSPPGSAAVLNTGRLSAAPTNGRPAWWRAAGGWGLQGLQGRQVGRGATPLWPCMCSLCAQAEDCMHVLARERQHAHSRAIAAAHPHRTCPTSPAARRGTTPPSSLPGTATAP